MSDWPGLEDSALQARLAAAIGGRKLQPERLEELRLTVACALRHPPALEAFDVLLKDEVRRVVRPLDPGGVDELTQVVRERLLVPTGAGPSRIEAFRADAPLRAWVRAVALRTALNERRGAGRELLTSALPELAAERVDPELALLRARYREAFRAAFSAAVDALGARERTVLRLHTLDGVTLARIGAIYRKDTSTISRWLESIRAALRTSTRAHLGATLALGSGELESLMRAADSELSVSLHRLLESAP